MEKQERTRKISVINEQLDFCKTLIKHLDVDFHTDVKNQNEAAYDWSLGVKNHTRYAEDTIRLRRELLKLERLFESAGEGGL